MRVKYIGNKTMDYIVQDNDIDLTPNKIYEATEENEFDFRVIDDSGEDYLYPKNFFEIAE